LFKYASVFCWIGLTAAVFAVAGMAVSARSVSRDLFLVFLAAAVVMWISGGSAQERDAQHVTAVQDEKVAETQAEGDRNIALAKCEALSGDRQSACKEQAKATYDLRIAEARQERASSDPKH
jgi:hypothetical protein